MLKSRFFVGLALVAGLTMCGTANAQTFYFDIWPSTADGDMNTYPDEGYSIAGEGNFRFTKTYHHMTFLGFSETGAQYSGYSDGPDKIPQGRQKGGVNDKNDGVLLPDWLTNKKAFAASVYIRNADAQTCDPTSALGSYINDPVTIVGFRVANAGPFVDRGTDANGAPLANGHGGCCAGYLAPLLDGGENAPGAWRMGRPPYPVQGSIGSAAAGATPEWYKKSSVDTVNPGVDVKVQATSMGFGNQGFGGNSLNSGLSGSSRWAFDWLVEKSDAMMVNSVQMTEASCTGEYGEAEPRDFSGSGTFDEGWFASHIDRCIINGIADGTEVKGLVFHSLTSTISPSLNTSMFGRDQGGGGYGSYLAITATLLGDMNNDGCTDVVDILTLVPSFGLMVGDIGYDAECDQNCDGSVDVVDLLYLVDSFGLCL